MTKSTSCIDCTNKKCIVKKYSKDIALTVLLDQKNTMRCRKGQSIIIEGSPIHGIYFVKEGKVKVYNTGINGREQILRMAINGEVLGQRVFSSRQTYPSGALALDETIMCHFTLDTMKTMLQTHPMLAFDFMVYYAEELNRTESKVRMFAHMTVREKVIDTLLYMHRKFGQKNNFLDIQLSRRDIADFAGTTEEQVIRIISALKKDKLIETSGKKLGIPKIDLLKREINDHHYFIQS